MNQTDGSHSSHMACHAALLALALSACAETAMLSTIKVAGREVAHAGHVHIERDQESLPSSAKMTLQLGDTVSTESDTTLVIRLGDARAILMPSTKVTLGSIMTWFGRVFISGWLQGKTKLVSGAVKGTQYVVEVDEKSGLTTFVVLEGTVQISSVTRLFPDIVLSSAQRVRVRVDIKQSPTVEPIDRGEYNMLIDEANRARDPALDQLLLPDLTGVKVEDAEAQLGQAGFEVTRREVIAPNPKQVGFVAGQSPLAGSASKRVELQVGRLFKRGDKAQIMAPTQVPAGAELALTWTGPNLDSDKIVLVPKGTQDAQYHSRLSLVASGGRGKLRAPAEAGPYELRFLTAEGSSSVLMRVPLSVTPLSAALQAPERVVAGASLRVGWQGPNRKDDQIRLVPVDTPDGVFEDSATATLSAATGHGSLRAPAAAGEYEIRYGLAGDWFKAPVILARARLTVTPVHAQVTAPATCEAGASFDVSWRGPSNQDDEIRLVPLETADSHSYPNLTLTAKAGRGTMRAPAEPGEYELRYALAGSAPAGPVRAGSQIAAAAIIARTKITVTPAQASFGDVTSGTAGATINVSWSGPNRDDDRILLAPATSPDNRYWADLTLPADRGNGVLRLPATAGDYELRYRLGGVTLRSGAIIARGKIAVTAVKAEINAPTTARADAKLKLSWMGPNRADDQVFLVPVKTPDNEFKHGLVLSAEGGRGNMPIPHEPGEYELRYSLGGPLLGGSAIIGRTKVRVVR